MSNTNNGIPSADDQDAAALLMLFQSQSTSLPSKVHQPITSVKENEESAKDTGKELQTSSVPSVLAIPSATPDNDGKDKDKEEVVKDVPTPREVNPSVPLSNQHTSVANRESSSQQKYFNETNQLGRRPSLSAKSSGSLKSHSRSNSGNNFNTSPGPAAAALAVDKNKNDSKKTPSNIKAMVAAAALAAAAATPFPLLSHEPKVEDTPTHSEFVRTKVVKTPETEDENQPIQETNSETLVPKQEPKDEIKDHTSDIEKNTDKTDVEMNESEEIDNILEQPRVVEREKTPEEASYYTDPDSGTIGCVCEYDHDDGFTIQCDRCYRWQHASCMGIKSMDEVPEFYLCYLCDKSRKVNKSKARETQRDFLMPTSKRKRLNSIDNETLREKIVEQVITMPATAESSTLEEESARRKSSASTREKDNQTPVGGASTRGRKPKFQIPKKDPVDVVDDTELFSSTKDGYKTVYFPTVESEFRNANTKHLFTKLSDLISSRKGPFPAVTDYTNADLQKKLAKSKVIVKPFGENAKMRFPGFSRFAVSIENSVSEEDFVLELVGEIQLKQDYIDNPFNHYNIWGVSKPKVVFIPQIPFVVDARYTGNEARFIRRACNPSCEVKTLLMKDDNSIRFVIRPTRALKLGQELTLPWDWDQSHPIHKIINGKTFDQLPDEEKPVLVRSIETVLNGCECACTNNNECYLYKVRKLLAYLYRSTRKINIPTFGNSLTKYSDIYRQRDESYYVPIRQRLDERHQRIISDTLKEPLVVNARSHRLKSDENSLDERREFVITPKVSALANISSDLLPYKYKISLQNQHGNEGIPRTLDTASKPSESSTVILVEEFPIPVPICKPMVMNRVPSVSGAIISSLVKISTSNIANAQDGIGTRPPVKKKMSLKDYIKNKKK